MTFKNNYQVYLAIRKEFENVEIDYHKVKVTIYSNDEQIIQFLENNIDNSKLTIQEYDGKIFVTNGESAIQHSRKAFIKNHRGIFY